MMAMYEIPIPPSSQTRFNSDDVCSYVILISGGSAVGPLIGGFMVQYTSNTWRSFVWLCLAVAVFNILLLVFLFPESNFQRPDVHPHMMQELETVADCKENESTFVENVPGAPPDEYTIHTPSLWDILPLIRYDEQTNFLLALISPLRLLTHPSILWVIFTYGIALSPQIIMMYVPMFVKTQDPAGYN